MSENVEKLTEEELKKREEEIRYVIDKLIRTGEKFLETEEYKNSPLGEDYKQKIVKVFPMFIDAVMKGNMNKLLEKVEYMSAGDAYVLGMLTGRLFFNMTKERI